MIDRLLKNNTEVRKKINMTANCGMNGFMIACRKGYAEVVSLFLQKASHPLLEWDFNLKDGKRGQTGLTMAVIEGHLEIVKLLTQRELPIDVNVNTTDDFSKTPFMYACQNGFKDIVVHFLKMAESRKEDFDLNAVDNLGNTAFHYACQAKKVKVVDLIVKSADRLKIELDVNNKEGKTGRDFWPKMFEYANVPLPAKRRRPSVPSNSSSFSSISSSSLRRSSTDSIVETESSPSRPPSRPSIRQRPAERPVIEFGRFNQEVERHLRRRVPQPDFSRRNRSDDCTSYYRNCWRD